MQFPLIAVSLLDAVNRGDTRAFLDLFTDDGGVDDWGSIYLGRAEVKAWSDRKLIGPGTKLELILAEECGDNVTLIVEAGHAGFNNFSRFTLVMEGKLIDEFRITQH